MMLLRLSTPFLTAGITPFQTAADTTMACVHLTGSAPSSADDIEDSVRRKIEAGQEMFRP